MARNNICMQKMPCSFRALFRLKEWESHSEFRVNFLEGWPEDGTQSCDKRANLFSTDLPIIRRIQKSQKGI